MARPSSCHIYQQPPNKALHPTAYSSVRSSLRFRRRVSLVLARSARLDGTVSWGLKSKYMTNCTKAEYDHCMALAKAVLPTASAALHALHDYVTAEPENLQEVEILEWEKEAVKSYVNAFDWLHIGFIEVAQKARQSPQSLEIAFAVFGPCVDIFGNAFALVTDKGVLGIDLPDELTSQYDLSFQALHAALKSYYDIALRKIKKN